MGHFGIRLQRARPRAHLSVLELRRAGSGPETGPRARTSWSRRTRPRLQRWSIRELAARNLARARRAGRAAVATASTRRSDYTPSASARGQARRDRARLHGAPPGHDASSPSPTRCCTGSCAARFHAEPIGAGDRACCCRNVRRAMSRSLIRRAEEVETAAPRIDRAVAADVRRLAFRARCHARRRTCSRTAATR